MLTDKGHHSYIKNTIITKCPRKKYISAIKRKYITVYSIQS